MAVGASSRRAAVVSLLVAVVAVGANVHLARHALTEMPVRDEPARYDRRMAALKPWLPASGVVGYLGDRSDAFASRASRRAYYLTQYALAPLVVNRTPAHRLIIGNFEDPGSAARVLQRHPGLRVVAEVGDGLYLLADDRTDRVRGRED